MQKEQYLTEDKGVKLETLSEGDNLNFPQQGNKVKVHYTGKLLDGTIFDSSVQRNQPFEFSLGVGQVIKGWDLGVSAMSKGQKVLLTCESEYAYGASGSPPTIPANATLQFEVELLDYSEDPKSFSDEQKRDKAKQYKEEGNDLFRNQKYDQAIQKYQQAVDFLDEELALPPVITTLYNNLAQCFIKIKNWSKAVEYCTKSIEKENDSIKAYYRRAISYVELQEFDRAQKDIDMVIKLEPNNVEIKKEQQNLNKKKKEADKKDKQTFKNLFSQQLYEDKKLDNDYSDKSNPQVWIDVQIGEGQIQRMEFELFKNLVPKTVENFTQLILGSKGVNSQGIPYSYKNTIFHRLIKDFMIQGGDFTKHNGTGGESIYGEKFEDENFKAKHLGRGYLSMANAGPNTNGSQFFITFKNTPHLDGKHVVFGKLTKGLEVLENLENAHEKGSNPDPQIKIVDCGQL